MGIREMRDGAARDQSFAPSIKPPDGSVDAAEDTSTAGAVKNNSSATVKKCCLPGRGMMSASSEAELLGSPEYQRVLSMVEQRDAAKNTKRQQRMAAREQQELEREAKRADKAMKKRATGKRTNLPVLAAQGQLRDAETYHSRQVFPSQVNPGNRHWAAYRPRWLIDAERNVRIAPADFQHYRKTIHCMTLAQCAGFLRVSLSEVAEWESGIAPIPYAAYLALRLVADVQQLPHQVKEWASWRIVDGGPDIGQLHDTVSGEMFSPNEIRTIRIVYSAAKGVVRENLRLKEQIEILKAQVLKLRDLRQIDGLTQELAAMQERMRTLLAGFNQPAMADINPGGFAQLFEVPTHETT